MNTLNTLDESWSFSTRYLLSYCVTVMKMFSGISSNLKLRLRAPYHIAGIKKSYPNTFT